MNFARPRVWNGENKKTTTNGTKEPSSSGAKLEKNKNEKSAADEFSKWADVPVVPDGKEDQYVKCDAHYKSGDCLWTFYCDLSTKHDCYKTDAPVLWDNGTYLGRDDDYLKAELQY